MLLLSYDGRLNLDDAVQRWIPEFAPRMPRISIRQLLHHQAGLRDWGNIVELSGWPRGTRAYAMPETVALIARQSALNFTPGSEYSYSNSNYVIAAEIVARASGESFSAFTQRRLFGPLGMNHTAWRDDYTRRVPRRTIAWTPTERGAWALDMPFESVVGHGGLLTTVGDLQRWQQNFATGAVGGARFTADMQRAGILSSGRASGYALGLELSREHGADVVSHGGSTAGYRAYLGRVPATGASVALLCNNGGLRSDILGPQLLALADGDTTAAADEVPPAFGPAAAAAEPHGPLRGQFRNERTGQAVQLRAFRDGVTLNTWVGYAAKGPNQFVSTDGSRTLSFIFARRSTVPTGFRIVAGTDTVAYRRADRWTPASTALSSFAGRFRSTDAEAVWMLQLRGDSLRVLRRPGQSEVLVPVYRDAFQAPDQGWLLTFRRDGRNRVAGFDVRMTRMRAMPFVRVPAEPAAR